MAPMFNRFLLSVLFLAVWHPVETAAHEFWIDPINHILETGETLEANLKVGQNYAGTVFPLLPGRLARFTVAGPSGTRDVTGTIGDVPAARLPGLPDGLHVLAYESTTDRLKFDDWDLFRSYVAYEGNDWAIDAHLSADLPKTGFTEGYRRYAKALVQIGRPNTAESLPGPQGLQIELVVLASPFTLPPDQTGIPVQLLWQDAPLSGQQINVFHMAESVTLTSVKTDTQGRAMIPVDRVGRYLINAVYMELHKAGAPVVWNSHWASLTFQIGPTD